MGRSIAAPEGTGVEPGEGSRVSTQPARALVVHDTDAPERTLHLAKGGLKVPIDLRVGAIHLEQTVMRIGSDESLVTRNDGSETTMYCAEGTGWVSVEGTEAELVPGMALFIPQATTFVLAREGREELRLIVILSPPPSRGGPPPRSVPRRNRLVLVREEDQPAIPAGEDRYFKVLVDSEHGALHVTQFVGFIEKSKAPAHTHTYEEAIYVLEGEGIAHIDGRRIPIVEGSSIFLPPGTSHSLENTEEDTLKILGSLSPPGSPGDRREVAKP